MSFCIVSTCSARPNFIKLASVHHALTKHPDVKHLIVHTGQHYDPLLSDVFFQQLEIPTPDFNLGVKGGEDRLAVIQSTADAMEPVLKEVRPDIVLVYGDVNGAVGAARAAKKLGIRVGHVEAGLRSFDSSMPEEHNRIEIDRLADLLFVSEQAGLDNLKKEKSKGKAVLVGNTMIDTLIRMMPIIDASPLPPIPNDPEKPFAVFTLHRPSNVDDNIALDDVMGLVHKVAKHLPVVLPIHHRLKQAAGKRDHVTFGFSVYAVPPLGYVPFLRLCKSAEFILTDSGGIQEEATFLGKRCFTLRRNTERPSTIESGSNVLIDPAKPDDRRKVLEFAARPADIAVSIPQKWDGKAGERIVRAILAL